MALGRLMWERHLAANRIEAGRLSRTFYGWPGFMWFRPNGPVEPSMTASRSRGKLGRGFFQLAPQVRDAAGRVHSGRADAAAGQRALAPALAPLVSRSPQKVIGGPRVL